MFKHRKKRRLVAEINVVPYIDVMLVLLIVFMITAPMLTQGVQVDLPKAPSAPLEETDNEPLVVSLDAGGNYYLNVGGEGKEPVALQAIQERVAKVLAVRPKTPVMVWGDASVDYGLVVELMTVLQNAGAPNVGLVTEPPPDDR